MANSEYSELRKVIQENSILRQELLNSLDEKEELVFLCQKISKEKEYIEKRYNNLKQSKLGSLTVWFWERRKKKNVKR